MHLKRQRVVVKGIRQLASNAVIHALPRQAPGTGDRRFRRAALLVSKGPQLHLRPPGGIHDHCKLKRVEGIRSLLLVAGSAEKAAIARR